LYNRNIYPGKDHWHLGLDHQIIWRHDIYGEGFYEI
jgi:hypothetical protein